MSLSRPHLASATRGFVHPVERALEAAPWFRHGDVVLAAVSGGADSMAMLHALAQLSHRRPALTIVAAHFDHSLRSGSALDLEVVATHAERLGVRTIGGRGEVRALARRLRLSLEAAARHARYRFLEESARRESASWIATAHTRSDQAETVLMRILRGTGARGLVGIAARRDAIVRPLLGVTREQTRDYCAVHEIAYVDDPSNEDRRFARNAVRHDVLPDLRRRFPGVDDALIRMADSAAREMDAIRALTTPRLDAALERESARTWVLRAAALDGLEPGAAAVLIGDALERIDRREDVARIHYETLASMRVGASSDLPRLRVRRDHDALVFSLRGDEVRAAAVREKPLRVPGELRAGVWTIRAEWTTGAEAREQLDAAKARDAPSHEHVAFAAAWSEDRFRIRPPRAGDRVQPFGMRGHRKLSDVFIDAKVPSRRRAASLVVERDGEIVWVPGVVTGEGARVSSQTARAVRFVARREPSPDNGEGGS